MSRSAPEPALTASTRYDATITRRPGSGAGGPDSQLAGADAKETVPCQLTQTPRTDAGF